MKKLAIYSMMIVLCMQVLAQAPESFSYQAIVRNTAGEPLVTQDVVFLFSIIRTTAGGTVVYTEKHAVETNQFGLVNLSIGNGTDKTGDFSNIDWGSDAYFLNVQVDKGDAIFVDMGTTQLISVPYAMYARNAKTSSDAVKYYEATQSVIGNNSSVINTGTGNILIGKSSGKNTLSGVNNIFLGPETGYFNTIGGNNVAIGLNALRENDEGSENIAIGSNALEKNKVSSPGSLGGPGFQNVAIGMDAMRNAVSNMNIAVGAEVLQSLTNGGANTGIGQHVMRSLINGSSNTAIGYMSMIDATGTASSNVTLGVRSGTKAAGLGNVFLGHESGIYNTGSQNVFIGYLAGYGNTWENVSNRLIIHNGVNSVDVPLIYGEFDNSLVTINGSFKATNGINANNKTITNVSSPVNSSDAATKAYVDLLIERIELLELFTLGFTDDRDGNTYRASQIGDQIWMAENLKYLPSVVGPGTVSETTPYYYVHGYDGTDVSTARATANYITYGVLYNWPALMNGAPGSTANPSGVQGVCPTGWHMPSDAEWTELTDYVGGLAVAGGKLKESGTTHWSAPNTSTNETGFTALPGGFLTSAGIFGGLGLYTYFWTATEYDAANAVDLGMYYDVTYMLMDNHSKSYGFYVRCLKD